MRKIRAEDIELMRRVIAHINERATERLIRLSDIAQALTVSEWRISSCLRKVTGRTFSQLVHDRRVSLACIALIRGGAARPPIKQVAFEVGYSRPEDFCRQFRERMSLTPSQWVRGARYVCLRDGRLDARRWRDPAYLGFSRAPDGIWQLATTPPPTPWAA